MKHPIALAVLSAAFLLLGACSHNDQRNCTTDCNIGAGTTVVTPGYGYIAPQRVYHRRYMAPSLYHPYRGYGHHGGHHGGSGFRLHMGGTIVIR